MCHKKKMILLSCLLVLAAAGVIYCCILAFQNKPERMEGTFVHACKQVMARCGL